ncbi:uncharacterized protein HRG_04418 [Hirsutella rhossiliensis]|uniref:Uncharacterized protein n=1 Tax=Hirsutella rhossiliensis TaxID=111463 RepID=A0A9P8MZ93_9HYPO|nr:uncharacterized protein HRG_04418 [Hirsutella rhossiliensis]KAH0963990.1 hypothetical protein HRG_04418 [Hirsutella rhossiliensis]
MAANLGSALNNAHPNTSLDAPHSEWDVINVPRMHASSQPFEQQAAFALFYPNGLPITYQMEHGKDSGGVPQYYLENHLPTRFYTNPPRFAAAKFSTFNGQGPFRAMGDLLPDRRVHLWNKDEIQSVCNSLRRVFKAQMKRLQRPTRWDHLWEFFDAYDMYHYGALNLWNVMNTLYDENCIIAQGCNAEMALEVGYFVDSWIKTPENRESLKQWNELDGPIWSILSADDWKEIRNLEDEDASLLKSALLYRRDILLAGDEYPHNKPPTDLMTACQSGELVNWLADAPVLGQNGMPTLPSSEPVNGSPNGMNAAAPCFVQQGYIYHPRGPDASRQGPVGKSAAVQALQKSADAATTKRGTVIAGNGVVIAMGSSKPPPGWEKRIMESAAPKAADEASMEESKPTPVAEPVHPKDEPEVKKTDPQGAKVEPDPDCSENAAPTAKGPRATASSPDLGSFSKSSKDPNEEAPSTKPLPESKLETESEGKPDQPHKHADIANDGKKSYTVQEPEGPKKESSGAGEAGEAGEADEPKLLVDEKPKNQGQQFGPRPVHKGRGNAPQLPYRPPLANASQRNYTAPGVPRVGRAPSVADGQWPPAEPSQLEPGNRAPSTSPKGGNWYGSRNAKGRGRGGFSGQRGDRASSQHLGDAYYGNNGRDERATWQGSWRVQAGPHNEAYANIECRNNNPNGRYTYWPCSCAFCHERNRGVWVLVNEQSEVPAADVQARLHVGMAGKFGPVEAVLPMPGHDKLAFVVRFQNEASVAGALRFGRGFIPEKQLSVIISALHRSKWINEAFRSSSRNTQGGAQFQEWAAGPVNPATGDEREPPKHAKAQSKPPSEEALDPVNPVAPGGPSTPTGQRSETSPTAKARVALPTMSPQEVHDKDGGKPKAKAPEAKPDNQGQSSKPAADAKDTTVATKAQQSKAGNEPQQKAGLGGKARAPSIFTEEQIKGRKQAWDRIPMPLNPHKVGKPANAVSGEPDIKSSKSEEAQHPADTESPKSPLRMEITLGDDSSSIKSDSGGSKTTTQEVFEKRYSSDKSGKASNSSANDAAASSNQPAGQASGDESSKQDANAASDPKSGPASTGQGPGQETLKGKNRKKNKKAKRVTTSTFAPHAGSARDGQQVSVQRDDEVGQGRELSGPALNMDARTAGLETAKSPGQSSSQVASAAGVRGDELSHRGPNLATDEGKAAGSTSQGQNDNSEGDRPAASGSKSRPAHYGPKQEYRADAGGSLRMQKKRRNRPHAIDTQSADSHGNSAGTPSSSSTSSFELLSRNGSDVNIVRHGQQGAVKDAAPNPGLNPLALTFVSPSHAAPENKGANAGKGGGYRGGSTKGGSGRAPNHQSPTRKDAREALGQKQLESKETTEHNIEAEKNILGQKDAAASQAQASKKTKSRSEAKKQDGSPVSAKEATKNKKNVYVEEWPSLPSPELVSPTSTAAPRASLSKGKQRAVADDTEGRSGTQSPVTGEAGEGQTGGGKGGADGGVEG